MIDIETYIAAARQHGEDSEPDHEVGDLQVLLRAAFDVMSESQRLAFAANESVVDTLAAAMA